MGSDGEKQIHHSSKLRSVQPSARVFFRAVLGLYWSFRVGAASVRISGNGTLTNNGKNEE
jgi:hypothetical protein